MPHGHLHRERLKREAAQQTSLHALPISSEEITGRLQILRTKLRDKLRLSQPTFPLNYEVHGRIERPGYYILRVSFDSQPGIRITGNLYVPEGSGPFPAVLNLHGHSLEGKIAPGVQARGHILAQHGIVTLTVDGAGSGERGDVERQWEYHGAMKAAELLLGGDSLMGQHVRDNQRALDLLQSLPFVCSDKLGVTGSSGGGNQTMWLSALDERITTAVLVVSVGSFEAYVCERNCVCETLPGGLRLAEEWEVLGLIAPRPVLIINALHDMPAFSYQPMSATCRQLEEIYTMFGARERLDWRLIDMYHGYHTGPMQAMLGWMKHWLAGAVGSSPLPLPEWTALEEEELLCYGKGRWPRDCQYSLLRETRRQPSLTFRDYEEAREQLSLLIGWQAPAEEGEWLCKRILPGETHIGAVYTERGMPLPVVLNGDWKGAGKEIRLLLSPHGKNAAFVKAQWESAKGEGTLAIAADLPGVGELAWEDRAVGGARLHDTSRACLWLGYTLIAEWAEAVAKLCSLIKSEAPQATIRIFAEQEAVFAVLVCLALQPNIEAELVTFDCPESAGDRNLTSMAWCVPGFLPWGDLGLLRKLAAR